MAHTPHASTPDNTPGPWTSRAWVALAAQLVCVLLAFADVLSSDRGLAFRDHLRVYKLRWLGVSDALRAGHLPAFTHGDLGGVPMEGLLNGSFTPGALWFLLLDFQDAYDVFVLFHFVLLGAGVHFLARRLGATPLEALLCAVVGSLSGPALSAENLVVHLVGLAYAPWMWFFAAGVFRRHGPAQVVGLALAAGCHFQGIMPETLLLDGVALLALAWWVRPAASDLPSTRALVTTASGVVLGLGVASVQLGPAVTALLGTRRGAGFDAATASIWHVSALQCVETLAPSFWAPPDLWFLNVPDVTGHRSTPYFTSFYVGTALVVLAAAAVGSARARGAWVLWSVFILGWVVASGPATPVHGWVTSLPILRNGRYPVKYLMLCLASGVALLPLGMRTLRQRPRLWVVLGAAHVTSLAALWWLVDSPAMRAFLQAQLEDPVGPPMVTAFGVTSVDLHVAAMLGRVAHALGCAVALLLVGLVASSRHRWSRHAAAALVLVVAWDLSRGAQFTVFGAPVEPHTTPPDVTAQLLPPRQRFYPSPLLHGRPFIPHSDGKTWFEERVAFEAIRGFNTYGGARELRDRDLDGQSNAWSARAQRLIDGLDEHRRQQLLARLGVGMVTSFEDPHVAGTLAVTVPGQAPHHFSPVEGHLPYVRAADTWRHAGTAPPEREWMDLLTDPANARAAIVLGDGVDQLQACAQPAAASLLPESADDHLVVETRAACPTLIVVQETRMPRWEATVDGAPATVLLVDAGFMGVHVPAGSHRVELVYRGHVETWAWVSLGSLVATLLLWWSSRRRERA